MSEKQPFCLVVVDKDSGFLTVLSKRAEPKNWQLRNTSSGVPPEELVAMKPDALIADPTALGDHALDYLKRVRERCPDLGMIVCTERSTLAQRVGGLRLGVDDWITKPCHPEEVLARVEAVSRPRRRSRTSQDSARLVFAELEIRPDLFQALVGGDSLDLTRREFEVLHLLADTKGQTLEREAIYQRVWGYAMAHGDRSVDVFIRKLRLKLENRSPGWRYIHTHFGVGYRFDPVPAAESGAPVREQAKKRQPARSRQHSLAVS